MTEDTITIEVDGKKLQARRGQMLIEVTDANDIYIPRFCYHPKLSIAANCRMCLVEVEKAPKPLPACATPVMDGMKVSTRSSYAREAQKSVMEFLLINHPLDCPICDQGGECELQDLAMGYGSDVSRYQEKKRVVKDKNIGPLVQTDMTRCIHCTRCVRFGEEIAGLRELGATGRGEHMEIGTYIEKSMVSELSGNVIDVCPVGALTNKPFRFSARTWEMTQHPGIAAHDGLGSNLDFHVKQDQVMRIVPGHNDAINETWLSDRDRYSYEGLYSQQRLTVPMIKQNGNWQEVDWQVAFDIAAERLKVITATQPEQLGALVSPQATTEEGLLLQKLVRGLGSHNIDQRLHQGDFSDQKNDPLFPWLGIDIADLEALDSALVIAGNPRKQQPLLNVRLRKSSLQGGSIMFLNPVDYDINYHIAEKLITAPVQLSKELAAILKAAIDVSGNKADTGTLLDAVQVSDTHRSIAEKLCKGSKSAILAGNIFTAHPEYSTLRYLAVTLAQVSDASFGYLGESANDTGLHLAGALPHRGPAGDPIATPGHDTLAMLETGLKAYLLFNIDPAMDLWDSRLAMNSLQKAETVIAMTAFKSDSLLDVADILLPISIYAENEGTYFNVAGDSQQFSACVPSQGEARPGWKILRVLADGLGIEDTGYENIADIQEELTVLFQGIRPDNANAGTRPGSISSTNGSISRFSELPMNSVDTLVRNATALQQTLDIADGLVHLNSDLAARLGLSEGDQLRLEQEGESAQLGFRIDDRIPDNAVLIHAAHADVIGLGPWFSDITVHKG